MHNCIVGGRLSFTLLQWCLGGCVATAACGGDHTGTRRLCRTLQVYEVNTADRCLEPPTESPDPCIFETEETTSGSGTDACLVGPDGKAFIIDHYGYTEDIEGDGWSAFWLEIADSPQESNYEGPPACGIARTLLREADAACEMTEMSGCDREWGFSQEFVEFLPTCE